MVLQGMNFYFDWRTSPALRSTLGLRGRCEAENQSRAENDSRKCWGDISPSDFSLRAIVRTMRFSESCLQSNPDLFGAFSNPRNLQLRIILVKSTIEGGDTHQLWRKRGRHEHEYRRFTEKALRAALRTQPFGEGGICGHQNSVRTRDSCAL
jgi:hypothetical protein